MSYYRNLIQTGASYPASLKLFIDAGNPASYSGSGTSVTDLIGTQNGTLINGVGYSSSDGGVFTLDGINDYIDFGTNSVIQPTSARTVILWVYMDVTAGNSLFYSAGDTGGAINDVSLFDVGFAFYNRLANATANQLVNIGPLTKGVWNEVKLRFNGTTRQIYINNVLIDSTAQTITPTVSGSVSVKLGTYNGPGYFLKGKIGVHKVYDEYRSTTDMTADWNEFKGRYGY
jgi:hypothetical protein